MSLSTIDLIVPNVPEATRFFADVVGFTANVAEERFAEIPAGAITLMLSPDAMVPMENAAGVILHVDVDDVAAAEERARNAGADILQATMTTDWGWESCLVQGPAGTVVDFFHPLAPAHRVSMK